MAPSLQPQTPTPNGQPPNHQQQQALQQQQPSQQYYQEPAVIQSAEFLPLCDLLFNIISLAAYFCDIVFDSVTVYTLYLQRNTVWFAVALFFVVFSGVVSQILSLRWYHARPKGSVRINLCVLLTHALQCGVLWRYFKLFIPVDLLSVKHEVRDLCMLRMVHAFCEASPMLLIQIYLMWLKPSAREITDLNIISTFLSLFSLCWALASFSKNVRRQNIHKLVLTWLGVIFQFFWRLGTVTSRVVALTVYATFYHYWIFAVIFLHWFSMLLWLLSPRKLFHGEKMRFHKRLAYSCLVAWVYIFCYINLDEQGNSRRKMVAFYLTMLLENVLLVSVCIALRTGSPWYQEIATYFVVGGFIIGVLFMVLYYKFFHIRHLKHTLLASQYDAVSYGDHHHCPEHGSQSNGHLHAGCKHRPHDLLESKLHQFSAISPSNGVLTGIPGVFNCRLNPALKRKKKKPSSFIPPPHPAISVPPVTSAPANTYTSITTALGSLQSNKSAANSKKPIMPTSPAEFWKKQKADSNHSNGLLSGRSSRLAASPLHLSTKHPFSDTIRPSSVADLSDLHLINSNLSVTPIVSDDLESSVGSRITNIQQKLQEKKQQQLVHLKEIEEEIRTGKLKPHPLNRIKPPTLQQAVPPQAKKQPWVANGHPNHRNHLTPTPTLTSTTAARRNAPFAPVASRHLPHYYYHPLYRRLKLRTQTPEVLLSPHYLDNSRVYYDYPSCVLPPIPARLRKPVIDVGSNDEDNANAVRNGNYMPPPSNIHSTYQQNIKALDKVVNREQPQQPKPAVRTSLSKSNLNHPHPSHNHQENGLLPHVANRHPNQQQHQHLDAERERRERERARPRVSMASDIDSQVSLPRSYTLPREFRYYRGNGASQAVNGNNGLNKGINSRKRNRKAPRNDYFNVIASNSSDDGDVDSDIYDVPGIPQIIRGPANHVNRGPIASLRSRAYNYHNRYKRHDTPL